MSSSRRKLQLVASFGVLLFFAAAAGCNGFFVDPILQTITVGPSGVGILVGKSQQMTAIGTYDDGTQKDVTGKASWTTSDQTIATVSTSGLATGAGAGTATITATSVTVSGSASITVSLAGVTSIAVTPSSQAVSASGGVPFCLQAIASPSGTDISSTATWAFTDPNNAAEAGINKTTGASCTGQAFLVTSGSLSPTAAPVMVKATASAPGTNGNTVTSSAVTVNITVP
jgi:trimeric autotransporter adhesin